MCKQTLLPYIVLCNYVYIDRTLYLAINIYILLCLFVYGSECHQRLGFPTLKLLLKHLPQHFLKNLLCINHKGPFRQFFRTLHQIYRHPRR